MTDDLVTLPYVARLTVAFLIAQPEVFDLVGNAVYTDVPSEPTFPLVRVVQLPGRIISSGSIYWLEETIIQVDTWGPGGNDRLAAHTLAETCRAVMAQRFTGPQDFMLGSTTVSAVVTGLDCGGIADSSDTAYQPARPHSRFDAVIAAHPLEPAGS